MTGTMTSLPMVISSLPTHSSESLDSIEVTEDSLESLAGGTSLYELTDICLHIVPVKGCCSPALCLYLQVSEINSSLFLFVLSDSAVLQVWLVDNKIIWLK